MIFKGTEFLFLFFFNYYPNVRSSLLLLRYLELADKSEDLPILTQNSEFSSSRVKVSKTGAQSQQKITFK